MMPCLAVVCDELKLDTPSGDETERLQQICLTLSAACAQGLSAVRIAARVARCVPDPAATRSASPHVSPASAHPHAKCLATLP
jgi:hypothetical protein